MVQASKIHVFDKFSLFSALQYFFHTKTHRYLTLFVRKDKIRREIEKERYMRREREYKIEMLCTGGNGVRSTYYGHIFKALNEAQLVTLHTP